MAFVNRRDPAADQRLFLAVGLLFRAVENGDVCLDLTAVAGATLEDPGDGTLIELPSLDRWTASLKASTTVGAPGSHSPLILDQKHRLYLHRYFTFERQLADQLRRRCGATGFGIDRNGLKVLLDRHFTPCGGGGTDWQRVAAVSAVLNRLTIISGGPGTGKTTVVARILTLLAEWFRPSLPRTLLTAPTGKAAARLGAAIQQARDALPDTSPARLALPTEAFTIHRLLTALGRGAGEAGNSRRLPVDILVVDEASMVDLSLMNRLVAAVPDDARLVILGDRDQLGSVEAGSVFADLCPDGCGSMYSEAFRDRYRQVSGDALDGESAADSSNWPLVDAVTRLRKNYRFGEAVGIGKLSRRVAEGDADGVMALLESGDGGVRWWPPGGEELMAVIGNRIARFHRLLTDAETPADALAAADRFRLLCPLRKGPFGVEAVNLMAENRFKRYHHLSAVEGWYPGRPVLVTRNHYPTRLFNGDCGIALEGSSTGSDGLRVWFPGNDSFPRSFHPARLPDHQTAFAMTVHQSQGSEYDEVFIVLPEDDSPVLNRALLYTAITRAKSRVGLWGSDSQIRRTVERRCRRSSGLKDLLWPDSDGV
jgi:exodeoxyribonuclease V alpha subunit